MTTRPANRGDDESLPLPVLPVLLAQAEAFSLAALHRRLNEEGFDGIRHRHGSVFRFIDPEGTRLTVLAQRSGLTKQAIGELVAELERDGYAERAVDPNDRRAKIIRLTERGKEGQLAAARILTDVEQRWAQALGRDRIAALRQTLQAVIDHETRPRTAH
jgi:DNA-binding MarR family transcriptional regulator